MKFYPLEGNRMHLDGGTMFGNAPKALWQKWITPDQENRIPLATRALLVVMDDGKKILFETGVGAFFSPKFKERYGITETKHVLLDQLRSMHLTDADIDAVVLSHLHFDHAGGLLPAYDGEPPHLLFPNATYFVGKEHFEWAKNPSVREKASFIPILQELLEKSGRLHLIEDARTSLLPDGISFHVSHGHTREQLLAEVGDVIFASDLVPGVPWLNIPITMGYDRFPEKKVEEKQAMYAHLIKNKKRLFLTHDIETTYVPHELIASKV